MKYDARLTAIHEAGHAAIAMSVGVGIRRATIRPAGGTHGEVNHYPIGKWFRPDIELTARARQRIEKHIMVSWAGTLAEELIGGRSNPDGASHDLETIVQLAGYVAGGEPEEMGAYIEWLRLRCRNDLSNGLTRLAVDAITSALLERTTLSGPEIREVVGARLLARASEQGSPFSR